MNTGHRMLEVTQTRMSPWIVFVVLLLAALMGVVWIFVMARDRSERETIKPIIRENSIFAPMEGVDGYRRVNPKMHYGRTYRVVRMNA